MRSTDRHQVKDLRFLEMGRKLGTLWKFGSLQVDAGMRFSIEDARPLRPWSVTFSATSEERVTRSAELSDVR